MVPSRTHTSGSNRLSERTSVPPLMSTPGMATATSRLHRAGRGRRREEHGGLGVEGVGGQGLSKRLWSPPEAGRR